MKNGPLSPGVLKVILFSSQNLLQFTEMNFLILLQILTYLRLCFCGSVVEDITSSLFQNNENDVIAAFGDFDADKLTDIFVISSDGKYCFIAQFKPFGWIRLGASVSGNRRSISEKNTVLNQMKRNVERK